MHVPGLSNTGFPVPELISTCKDAIYFFLITQSKGPTYTICLVNYNDWKHEDFAEMLARYPTDCLIKLVNVLLHRYPKHVQLLDIFFQFN